MLNQEIYRTALEGLPTGVCLVDLERRILLWSKGAEEITGYLAQEVIGRPCGENLLMYCEEKEACLCGVACPMEPTLRDGRLHTVEAFLRHKDGHEMPVKIRAVPLRNEHGSMIGVVEWFDRRAVLPPAASGLCIVTPGASAEEHTALPDRAAVLASIAAYLKDYESSPVPFTVLAIAVDGLDQVCHTGGSNAVDALLHGTSETLANAIGPNDMIGRWAKERFMVLLTGCATQGMQRWMDLARRLVQLEGVPWWGERIHGSISIGGTVVRAGDTPEELVGRAEAALGCRPSPGADFVTAV